MSFSANQTGHVELAAGLRHKSSPLKCLHFALGYALHVRFTNYNLFDLQDFVPLLASDSKRGVFICWPFFDHYVVPGVDHASKIGGRNGKPSNTCKMKIDKLNELYTKMQGFARILWELHKRHFNRGQAARCTEAAGRCPSNELMHELTVL